MTKKVESKNNQTIKLIKKLKEKKYRDIEDVFIVEGPNILRDAIKNKEEIVFIGIDASTKHYEEYNSFITSEYKDKVTLVDSDIYKGLTETVSPQDILGLVKKRKTPVNKDKDSKKRFVVLDELQDPGNVGTVIRTAEAAGFTGVIAIKGTADFYSSKVIRSAAGSLFRINLIEFHNREDAYIFLNDNNVKLYACDGQGEVEFTEVDLRENIGIIIGNEGNGINDFFKENCTRISIPMSKNTESLNAAVAAGIIIYESVRQRKITCKE